MTELHTLAANGDIQGVERLIASGVDIDADDVNLGTALYQAILKNHANVLQFLLQRGADPNAPVFDNQWRVLMFAVVSGYTDAFEFLLTLPNIDINAQNKKGDTALHYCIKMDKTAQGQKLLQRKDLDPNIQNTDGRTPLMMAVTKENLSLVKGIIEHPECNPAMKGDLQDSALTLTRNVKNKKISVLVENAVLEHFNTPIGLAFRDDNRLRQYCERFFALKVREYADINENRVDERWLEWKVPIKQPSHVTKALSIMNSLRDQGNMVALATPATGKGNEGIPMAKAV